MSSITTSYPFSIKNWIIRHKAGALVALLERVRLDNARHHPDGKDNDILLAVGEGILWARERTLQQSPIAQNVVFTGDCHQPSIYLNDRLDRQPLRLIRQGLSGCSENGR